MLVDYPEVAAVGRMTVRACTELLGADAAGLMLQDPRGGLRVVAATDEQARFVEMLQSQTDQGPCVECVRIGSIVAISDLADEAHRWPAVAGPRPTPAIAPCTPSRCAWTAARLVA